MSYDPVKSLIPYIEDRAAQPDAAGFLPEGAAQPIDVLVATLLKSGLLGDYIFSATEPAEPASGDGTIWLKPGGSMLGDGEVKVWNGSAWVAGEAPWTFSGGGGAANAALTGVDTIEAHGGKGDAVRLTDCSVTAGSNIVSSAAYDFTGDDVGKAFTMPYAAAAGGAPAPLPLSGAITGISGTDAIISLNAGASVTAGEFVFGADDSAAWLSLVAAMDAAAQARGGHGGVARLNPGRGYYIKQQAVADYAFDVDLTGADVFMAGLPSAPNLIQNGENTFLIKWSGVTHANAVMTGAAPQVLGAHPNQTAKTVLTQTLERGDVIAQVASTSGMKRGDLVALVSEHDVAWDLGSASYHYRAMNRIEQVIDATSVRLKYAVRARAISASGAVAFMAVDVPRERVVIRGGGSGKVWGNRTDVNMANGAGQHFAQFNGIGQAIVDGVHFEGVTGYTVNGLFCDDVVSIDCYTAGRDTRVPYVEDQTSMFGGVMTHFCNNQIVYNSRATRVRHLVDGGTTGRIVVHGAEVIRAATSALRTHLSCEVMELHNCIVEGSGGIGLEAEIFVMRGGRMSAMNGSGLITVSGTYNASPTLSVDIEGAVLEMGDTDDPEDATPQGATGLYFVGDFDKCRVANCSLRINGGQPGVTAGIYLGGSVAQGHSIRGLDISNNHFELNGSPDGVVPIHVSNGRVFGVIENNKFRAPNAGEIIKIQEPTIAGGGRLIVRFNTEVSEGPITANDMCSWIDHNGDHWDEDFIAHDNYSIGPAFPKAGKLSSWGAYFDFNLSEPLAQSLATCWYTFDGHMLTIRFSNTITDKQGHSGRLVAGKLPAYAVDDGNNVLMGNVEISGVAPAKNYDAARNIKARIRPTTNNEFVEFYAYTSAGAFEFIDHNFIDDAVNFGVFGSITIPLDQRVRRLAA